MDASVVLCDDSDIVLDDTLAKVLPAGMGLRVWRGCRRFREDVGGTKMATEFLGNDGPPHKFGNGEEFQKLGFWGGKGISSVGVDTMEKVGLLIVIWREYNIVNNPLKDLKKYLELLRDQKNREGRGIRGKGSNVRHVVALGFPQQTVCQEPAGSAYRHPSIYYLALRG